MYILFCPQKNIYYTLQHYYITHLFIGRPNLIIICTHKNIFFVNIVYNCNAEPIAYTIREISVLTAYFNYCQSKVTK